MVELGNDPFMNSIELVKRSVFYPLESSIRKAAKDFEYCIIHGVSKCGNLNRRLDRGDKSNVNLSMNGLEKRHGSDNGEKNDKNRGNLLHFEATLSFLVNGFKSEKGLVEKMSGEDNFRCNDSKVKLKEFKVEEGNNFPFEFSIAFVFDQLSHLPKFDASVRENEFGHFKALTSLLEGKQADVSLKFARVGGVAPGIVRPAYVNDEEDEGTANAVTRDEDTKLVAVPPPVEINAKSVLKSALAGGLSCSFSTALMHPLDTVKTQVQASTSLGFVEILSKLPQIGVRGVYKGSIPAILGQFTSHGLRTGIYEVSKRMLTNVAPTAPELQVQSMASFCATVLGTVWRVPCEVLKQRLQANVFDNTGEAIVGTWKQDGLGGFFRGTGATLCREIPFYVAGAGLYAESKKAVKKVLRRDLEPWETIIVGAISGGLIAISTTPFDVIKTRMMISPEGQSITASMVALSILQSEGPLGLFRGALPRFFWIAPLGAINFAGYELLRKAMEKW